MKTRMFTLPNMLTLCNLLCGCTALVFCLRLGDLRTVLWLVVAAAVFDFLDGFAARITRSYSELGKQLDSLADMVSFGAVPSAVLFTVFLFSGGDEIGLRYGLITACVALFSALRLAKFNIDDGQSVSFTGLPTPACALLVASGGWLFAEGVLEISPAAVLAAAVVLSFLLVAPMKMFALKFCDWSWKSNKVRYTFLLLSAASLAVWHIAAVPFIIAGYILISLVLALACKRSYEKVSGPNE